MLEQFICYMIRTIPTDSEEATKAGVTYTEDQRWAIKNIQDSLDDNESDERVIVKITAWAKHKRR